MAVFRVTNLYCAGCRSFKRCRIQVVGEGLDVYPDCGDCGGAVWYESEPPTSTDVKETWAHDPGDTLPGLAPFADLQQFFSELGQQQAQYLRRMFDQWQEQRNDGDQAIRDAVEADRARMWREVWAALESAPE